MLRIESDLTTNAEVIYLPHLDESAHCAQTYAEKRRSHFGAKKRSFRNIREDR
jgi:hypothetical protein